MYLGKNLKAFTLAEVLITLGIIGVIASMTMPVFIQNYKKQVASVKIKKFFSVMNQAIRMSEIDNGPSSEWTMPANITDEDGNTDWDKQADNNLNYFNIYLKPYLKVANVEISDKLNYDSVKKKIIISLADGSTFYFRNGGCIDIDFDTNGTKSPNKFGSDLYKFVLCPKSNFSFNDFNFNFRAYCPSGTDIRSKAMNSCELSRVNCNCLLQYDNWEFKDDYPYKL